MLQCHFQHVWFSSKLEKSDAPESCENWFVMINAPSHESQDWRNSISQLRARVIKILGDRLQVNLEKLIATERIWSPPDIQRDTMSFKGALYGTSSNSQLAAFLRHPNFSNNILDSRFIMYFILSFIFFYLLFFTL